MRRYAALYNSVTQTWSVIFNDQYEVEWYVDIPDAGGQDQAVKVANALNAASS